MALRDLLRRKATVPDDVESPMPGFVARYGEVTRFVADAGVFQLMTDGLAQRSAQEQFLVLDMAAESGRAVPLPDGFELSADDVAELDDEEAQILMLPPRYDGPLEAHVHRWTTDPEFAIRVVTRTGPYPEPHERRGPLLVVGQTPFRLTTPQLRAFRALERHAALPAERRTEAEAVRLVAQLQTAQRLAARSRDASSRDLRLDLGELSRFTTTVPRTVGLTVTPQPDGSLEVEPDLGSGIDRELLRTRWHQADKYEGQDAGVLRVGDDIVLLERDQLRGVAEVRRRPRIAPDEVSTFYAAPGAFFDPDLVDVDVHLSMRVAGLGVVAQVSYAQAEKKETPDWFGKAGRVEPPTILSELADTSAEFDEVVTLLTEAAARGEVAVAVGDRLVSVEDADLLVASVEVCRAEVAEREAARSIQVVAADDRYVDADAGAVWNDAEAVQNGQDVVTAEPSMFTEDSDGGPELPPDIDTRSGETRTVGWYLREASPASARARALASAARPRWPIDWAALRRTPFAHQREGIEWLTGLLHTALMSHPVAPRAAAAVSQVSAERVRGALLADDMGLGKTFMVLAALHEAIRLQRADGHEPRPTLAVMPVALLENWRAELRSTFGTANGPFDDVVVLHGEGLARYRKDGRGKESQAAVEDLDGQGMVREDRLAGLISLHVGPQAGRSRLDAPNTLVLTTYDTLRRHQVSLATVDWGVVVLDEAQATKNPDILVTRAAKALRAQFTLLATGTPVENSLRDFWCLLDTAQPGLLGTWAQFRENWEAPMAKARGDELARLGRDLREAVGPFMMRRIKEDHLPDLPAKSVVRYRELMPPTQVEAYDAVIDGHRDGDTKRSALATLGRLRDVSLHPWVGTGLLAGESTEPALSARTTVAIRSVLDAIRDAGEKAIVFVDRKEVQKALALWIIERYRVRADVVNGDVSATSADSGRIARIRRFEAREGFNVIIMSPLSVGVGLTVVGANHAIHLERLWNPAKEAQATDRVYRIGQTRPVTVHYPMAIHPDVDSFDVNLDRLLESKQALKDAVVAPQQVSGTELEEALGLR